jgi:hypothetical protein
MSSTFALIVGPKDFKVSYIEEKRKILEERKNFVHRSLQETGFVQSV